MSATDPVNFTDPMGLWASRIFYKRDDKGGYAGVGWNSGPTSGGGMFDSQGYRIGGSGPIVHNFLIHRNHRTGKSTLEYTGSDRLGVDSFGSLFNLASQNSSGYVPDDQLPPYAHILRGRRVTDPRTGDISIVNLPRNYRFIPAPRGGEFLLVPPGWVPGSEINIIRMQPAGTGSVRHNAGGYFVVYGQNGAALDLRTGRAVPANDPRAHNPWGGVIPPLLPGPF